MIFTALLYQLGQKMQYQTGSAPFYSSFTTIF
jgi:hypothetical protein